MYNQTAYEMGTNGCTIRELAAYGAARAQVVGEENALDYSLAMDSEDFSRFGEVVPAVFFRLGTGNKEKGITSSLHHTDFNISEDALINGVKTIVQFVIDNQKGIDKEKEFVVIENRRSAIEYAVCNSRPRDIIILAGKGHERYEIDADGRHYFDEREIVRSAYKRLIDYNT